MPDTQSFITTLRQRGYRITPQREMIIDTLAHSDTHMTAEEIFNQVRALTQATDIATVYRTLDLLVEEGLACQNDLGGGRVVYITRRHGPHIHLICRQCGHVIDADNELLEPLRAWLQERYGFEADLHHISISGVCDKCLRLSQS